MSARLLWIDDEWRKLTELVDRLRAKSWEVDCAASVHEGISKLDSAQYDLVIVDIILPRTPPETEGGDRASIACEFAGLDVVRTVQQRQHGGIPKIIVLTIAEDDLVLKRLEALKRQGVVTQVLRKGLLRFQRVTDAVGSALGKSGG